jgi:hypothetical protein
MKADMEAELRLRRIESVEEIRCLKARYCDLCDDGYDADSLVGLFTPDGTWDGGDLGRFEGQRALHGFFSNMPRTMSFALHHITNSAVRVSEDCRSAQATWYLLQTATLQRDNRAVLLAGRYQDNLVYDDGQWRFRRMTIRTRFFTPLHEGWAQTPNLLA